MAAHVGESIFLDFHVDHVGAATHRTVLNVLLLATFATVHRDNDVLAAGAAYIGSFVVKLQHRFVNIIYVIIHSKVFGSEVTGQRQ